jgi:hypothetical protein
MWLIQCLPSLNRVLEAYKPAKINNSFISFWPYIKIKWTKIVILHTIFKSMSKFFFPKMHREETMTLISLKLFFQRISDYLFTFIHATRVSLKSAQQTVKFKINHSFLLSSTTRKALYWSISAPKSCQTISSLFFQGFYFSWWYVQACLGIR